MNEKFNLMDFLIGFVMIILMFLMIGAVVFGFLAMFIGGI